MTKMPPKLLTEVESVIEDTASAASGALLAHAAHHTLAAVEIAERLQFNPELLPRLRRAAHTAVQDLIELYDPSKSDNEEEGVTQ